MNGSPIKSAVAVALLFAGAHAAAAQPAPLALPPEAQLPVVISAPEAPALALPPSLYGIGTKALTEQKVEAVTLNDIEPDTVGLIVNHEGGFGAEMWKDTNAALVDIYFPALSLPLSSAAMNDIAHRFLITTASPPETKDKNRNLTALRVEKLLDLGYAAEAWKLANLDGLDRLKDLNLRQLAETALTTSAADDVCAHLPAIMKTHTATEWQKLMVVCQLRAKDTKAAQVSLDLLRAQSIQDDTFFALAEKNIIGGSRQLPRQLTPLKPVNLALLRLIDAPLRTEIYAHADPALITALLKTKSADNNVMLALAERAAAKNLITASDLAEAYRTQTFTPEALAHATVSGGEQGPRLRALLYQASQQEKTANNRIAEALHFTESLSPDLTDGGMLQMANMILGDVAAAPEHGPHAAAIARLLILADKPAAALSWLELAQSTARTSPPTARDLQNLWPLMAATGLTSPKDFPKNLDLWLDAALQAHSSTDTDMRETKTAASSIMLILDALGYPISDEDWAKTATAAAPEKITMPPTLVMERLHKTANANRKAEAVLMACLAMDGGKDGPALPAALASIRALKSVGLTADAEDLAKNLVVQLTSPAKP